MNKSIRKVAVLLFLLNIIPAIASESISSVAEIYKNGNPGSKASKSDIRAFVYGLTMNCKNNVKGSEKVKAEFCSCVVNTIEHNMINRLSPKEAKDTISGAAQGVESIPHLPIVYYGIQSSCENQG